MKVSNFRFHNRPVLEWPIGEDDEFVVAAPLRVSFLLDGEPIRWTVPVGTKTDLASIPDLVPNFIVKRVAWHIPAAVVHDELCLSRPWTSRVAADIFNEAMKAIVDVLPEKERDDARRDRILMWRAVVRLGPRW